MQNVVIKYIPIIEDGYCAMDGEYRAFKIPIPVGFWEMNGISVSAMTKPNFFHKFMARLLLGWEWKDAE